MKNSLGAIRPYLARGAIILTVKPRKVCVKILLRSIFTPEAYRHRREGRCGYQFTCDTIFHRVALSASHTLVNLVIDRDRDTETGTLTSADVHWTQRILHSKTGGNISASGDIRKLRMRGEPFVVEPFEERFRKHHAGAGDDLQPAEIGDFPRLDFGFAEFVEVSRRSAEVGDSMTQSECEKGRVFADGLADLLLLA